MSREGISRLKGKQSVTSPIHIAVKMTATVGAQKDVIIKCLANLKLNEHVRFRMVCFAAQIISAGFFLICCDLLGRVRGR